MAYLGFSFPRLTRTQPAQAASLCSDFAALPQEQAADRLARHCTFLHPVVTRAADQYVAATAAEQGVADVRADVVAQLVVEDFGRTAGEDFVASAKAADCLVLSDIPK